MGYCRREKEEKMKLVVDTSILIDYLRGGRKWEDFLLSAPREAELFLPTIVIFELFSGQSSRNLAAVNQINDILKELQIIELDSYVAIKAGELYRDVRKQISVQDYIIAASSLEIGAKVVTLNRKDFEIIPGLAVYSGI